MQRLLILSIFVSISLASCKTSYEKVRTSNDPNSILEAANKYYENESYTKAQGLYDIVIPFFRGKAEAQDLFYNYAYTYFYTDQFLLATHYFGNFAKTFYNSPKKEEAEFMEAYSQSRLSPNHRLDQSYSQKAIEAFQKFINNHPESPRVAECNTLIDDLRGKMELKAFEQGDLYYNIGQHQAAITSFENMMKDFPETDKAERIRYLIIKSNYILATNSIFAKKQDRYNETLRKVKQFTRKYAVSKYLKELEGIEKDCLNSLKEISDVRLEK